MIVYNVTTKLQEAIQHQWLEWLKNEHIPIMLQTGCFTHAIISRLLEVDDDEGPTYTVQYHAESKAQYNRYIEQFAEKMREQSFEKWGNAFIAFRSVMQVVN